jgi:hypothetical protein
MFLAVLLAAAASTTAFCAPDGVLTKVITIQVDPTVVPPAANIKDPSAANLVRFDLRAAVREARFLEGKSPVHAHILLDGFGSPDGKVKRALNLGTGRADNIVDGKLVIADASGKPLATREIHFHGNVGLSPDENNADPQHRQPVSDFEQVLIDELQRLR